MKRKFKHFIVVKFDYPENYPYLDTKKQQLRWGLLETLRRQTNKEFVMVFNSTMPMPHEGFGELIISPCWKDKVRDAAKDYEYVITTRLDGDDFVTENFVQVIQDNFEEKDKLVLMPGGWTYDSKTKKLTDNWMCKNYTTNALSFIEKSNDIQSCYVSEHGKMGKLYDVKRIDNQIHIWCINEESLRAGLQKEGKYTDNFPDTRENLYKCGDIYREIVRRIDVFNNRIKSVKKAKSEIIPIKDMNFVSNYFRKKDLQSLKNTIRPPNTWNNIDKDTKHHLELLGIPDNVKDIFEIGAGIGRMLKPLADGGYNCKGCDACEEMVVEAKNYAENVPIGLCDGSGIVSEQDNSFDFVFSWLCFQHIPNTEAIKKYISEAYRILRKGKYLKFQLITAENNKPPLWCYHNTEELKKHMGSLGFENIYVERLGTCWFMVGATK